ncbi:dTDP-glucose 4,6-dehydratase [Alkaliphilus crotonatoxidans]
MKIVVTGGMGFIGSHFVKKLVKEESQWEIINLDKLTYAANPQNVEEISKSANYQFVKGDIGDVALLNEIITPEVDAIVNFAAESHVDRSITNPSVFIRTNVLGTQALLEAAVEKKVKRFVQISTDEVYGSIKEGSFSEKSFLNPSSPYSASKAAGDLLVLAYYKTYGIHSNIVRGANNYGPCQFPEKLIPKTILKAAENEKIPMYGDGQQEREWIFVEDFCHAIKTVLMGGAAGQVYNAGSGLRLKNIDLIKMILNKLGKSEALIQSTADRLGHDYRYAMNNKKIKQELGWAPQYDFDKGLTKTIEWYISNTRWWGEVK